MLIDFFGRVQSVFSSVGDEQLRRPTGAQGAAFRLVTNPTRYRCVRRAQRGFMALVGAACLCVPVLDLKVGWGRGPNAACVRVREVVTLAPYPL